jgi:hypothetical protein
VQAPLIISPVYRTKIRDHIETKTRVPLQQAISDLYALDQEVLAWSSSLPAWYRYSTIALHEQMVTKQDVMYSNLWAIYHQCRLALHASHVPQLSGHPAPEGWPPELIHSSARTALESARSLSTLATDLFTLEWDPGRLAPFTGYCMFAAAVTLLVLCPAESPLGSPQVLNATFSSLRLLDAMRPYWKHLDRLVSVLACQLRHLMHPCLFHTI